MSNFIKIDTNAPKMDECTKKLKLTDFDWFSTRWVPINFTFFLFLIVYGSVLLISNYYAGIYPDIYVAKSLLLGSLLCVWERGTESVFREFPVPQPGPASSSMNVRGNLNFELTVDFLNFCSICV